VRDAAILPKYVRAGVAHVYVGVEATDQATLDLIHKENQVETASRPAAPVRARAHLRDLVRARVPRRHPETIKRTLELSKLYDPDFAHYLAITPWPYADIWNDMAPHVASRDYRKYNLIDPVIRPRR